MILALLVSACLAAPSPTPTQVQVVAAFGAATFHLPPGAWIVTATATATPKPPRLPQAKLEATCVAGGHRWFEGDGFILERASDRVVGFPVPAYWAAYCRRCGLWKEVKP